MTFSGRCVPPSMGGMNRDHSLCTSHLSLATIHHAACHLPRAASTDISLSCAVCKIENTHTSAHARTHAPRARTHTHTHTHTHSHRLCFLRDEREDADENVIVFIPNDARAGMLEQQRRRYINRGVPI